MPTLTSPRKFIASAVLLLALFASGVPAAPKNTAQIQIRAALTQWMTDFNSGNSKEVCTLFAPDLISDYPGQPQRDYKTQCALLQRSLTDSTKKYTYSLSIKEILVSGDLAVVRLVWTLKIQNKQSGVELASEEPGMDVFRRQPDGNWKISRYIAYEAPQR
jgi:ketosteroid isomerase-like protein